MYRFNTHALVLTSRLYSHYLSLFVLFILLATCLCYLLKAGYHLNCIFTTTQQHTSSFQKAFLQFIYLLNAPLKIHSIPFGCRNFHCSELDFMNNIRVHLHVFLLFANWFTVLFFVTLTSFIVCNKFYLNSIIIRDWTPRLFKVAYTMGNFIIIYYMGDW